MAYIKSLILTKEKISEFQKMFPNGVTVEQAKYLAKLAYNEINDGQHIKAGAFIKDRLERYFIDIASGVETVLPQMVEEQNVVPDLTGLERFICEASKGKTVADNIIADALIELKCLNLHRATAARLEVAITNINIKQGNQRMLAIGDIEAVLGAVTGKQEITLHKHGAII